MPSANIIILQYVCPGLGAVLSNLMCLSPVRDVQRATKQGRLGDMNPTPWVFMFGQSLGWVTYGIVHQNLWLFFSDCLGLIVGVWLNLSAIKLLYKEQHTHEKTKGPKGSEGGEEEYLISKKLPHDVHDDEDQVNETRGTFPIFRGILRDESQIQDYSNEDSEDDIEDDSEDEDEVNETQRTIPIFLDEEEGEITSIKRKEHTGYTQKNKTQLTLSCHDNKFMLVATLWFLCISIVHLVPSITQDTRETTVAMMASLNLILFYCAPLSTIATVLKEKDTSSIHIATMIANTVNASFWTTYGYAINDWSIIIPNGLGGLFGVIQITLCAFIPRKSKTIRLKTKNTQRFHILMSRNDNNIKFPVKL